MKKITFAALLLAGFCVVASPKAVAQDNTFSQSSAADSTADAITNQQLALLRRDIRSIKKQLIAANLTLADSEATKFWRITIFSAAARQRDREFHEGGTAHPGQDWAGR